MRAGAVSPLFSVGDSVEMALAQGAVKANSSASVRVDCVLCCENECFCV